MGGTVSYPGLTEDLIEDYSSLTYLSKGEILYLMKKFNSIDPEKMSENYEHRFHQEEIIKKFDAIKNNPFRDRMLKVFSSQNDECFSFEDLLDLCSVMSSNCPPEVKAEWAFKIFDLDADNQISEEDVIGILDRLTGNEERQLDMDSKIKIARLIIKEINLDNSGSISLSEFKFLISRMPEFESSFYFRL